VYRLAHLAEAELAIGRSERARELAAEALAIAQTKTGPPSVIPAYLAWIRVELATTDPVEADQIGSRLQSAFDLVAETGARRYEPLLRVERATLAERLDDQPGREQELREAARLFAEIGADGHVERLSEQLAIATEQG
jgi:hypothetical protein